MALHRTTLGQQVGVFEDLVRVLLIVAAVIVLMLVLTAIFGMHQAVPSLQIVPDPAGALGLPF
jgi:hypothetical protein